MNSFNKKYAEDKTLHLFFEEVTEKATSKVSRRLGEWDESRMCYVISNNDWLYVDMEIFDSIEGCTELSDDQKKHLLNEHFNGIRPQSA